jgi:hypothetical protein
MAEGIIKAAIEKLESKHIPQASIDSVFVPEERYRSILPLLNVWGYRDNDSDIQEKAKYIYSSLLEINKDNPSDTLTTLLTELGATRWNDSKLERVYKYFHLRGEAEKALKYHDLLNKEINELKGK